MSTRLDVFIPGKPEPAGSKRGFARGRHVTVVDANPKAASWKALVGEVVAGRGMLFRPTELIVAWFDFYLQRPRGHFGSGRNAGTIKAGAPVRPPTKPDALKLARAVEDALTGVVYPDDAQIVEEHLAKHYAEDGQPVGVRIRLWSFSVSPAAVFVDPEETRVRMGLAADAVAGGGT